MEAKISLLKCPACIGPLSVTGATVHCNACLQEYPTWNGIPVLLLSSLSLFDAPNEAARKNPSAIERVIKQFLPSIGHNLNAKSGYAQFSALLNAVSDLREKVVIVVGAGQGGIGIEALLSNPAIQLVNLDVLPSTSLDVIGDAHYLPMADGSCDGVVIQAVLEHVLDPARVVREIHRVLKPGGIVYAETPFMQMVHERAYDYTRFSDLGHRYLFRNFLEIERGITGGPGMTLLWAWCYFLRAFFRKKFWANAAMAVGRITGFWLLWMDKLLRNKPGAYDACSGLYFLGRKTENEMSARSLVKSFRGL